MSVLSLSNTLIWWTKTTNLDEGINPKTSVLKNKVNLFDHLIYYKILDLGYKPNMSNICIKS